MRKILLSLMLTGALVFQLSGQAPRLWLSEDEFNKGLSAGGSDSQMVVIKNMGNRDLIWSLKDVKGPEISFSKADYADWSIPENQDRIKPAIWISRADEQGIFNIAVEEQYFGNSPENTLWAFNRTMDAEPMDYTDWRSAVNSNPPSMVDQTISMFLPDYMEFFDVVFHSWTEGGNGGGFSYTRFEVPVWLEGSKSSGTIIPGAADTLWVFYNGEYLYQKEYIAYVTIQTNDPVTPLVNLTFNLNVTSGNSDIELDESSVDYGNAFVSYAKPYSLKIYNNGTGTLVINNITTGFPEFSSQVTNLEVPAKDNRTIEINFTPVLKKSYMDTLYISSNDTADPIVKIPLTGTGIAPVDISINPLSFNESAVFGTPLVKKLAISNTDSSNLEWEIKVNTSLSKFGPSVNFTKADGADWTQASNQDMWTPNVIITRANSQGIFNIANESSYQGDSPTGTLWSFGKTGEVAPEDYEIWRDAVNDNPPSMIGNPVSVYLPDDDIYADIVFDNWTAGGGGGGFSYTRQLLAKWIHPETFSGTTTAVSTDTVLIDFNTFGLSNGTYNGSIVIISNDPDEDSIVIPVQLTITGGVQNINVNTIPIDFGDVFTGDTKTLTLDIENDGKDDLTVSGIITNNNEFKITPVSFALKGDSVKTISIELSPVSVKSFIDTLYISSNDPETPIVKIPVTANAIAAPDIELPTEIISVNIMSGDTVVYKLSIKNTGGNDLEYDIPGVDITDFTKANYADWKLADNQDRITDNVWITRANSQGIFNIFSESNYNNSSPEGTEWAYGNSTGLEPENYEVWRDAVMGYPPGMVGNTISLHLIEKDIYYDVEFKSWTESADGGGFSYTRYKALPKWLELQNTSGLIVPGQTDTIELWFIATGLNEMTYNTDILIRTNSPGKETVILTADMVVTGKPDISIASTDTNFGSVYIGYPDTLQLMVRNTGTDSLIIENTSTLTSYFGTVEDQLLIMPGEQKPLHIFFSPEALTDYEDTLKFTTNVAGKPAISVALKGKGANPPNLMVQPEMLSYYTFYDNIITDTIVLTNNGTGQSIWDANLIDSNIKLDDVLNNLNNNNADIISTIPNIYYFSYDGDNYSINDGGNDMYDGGNFISTSSGSGNIKYSDNKIIIGDLHFGENTSYFTRHMNGLFVLAADLNKVESFRIDGNLGADGGGNYDETILEYDYHGIIFKGFVKRVYTNNDPSVNHLIIIEDNPDVTQTTGITTDDDKHHLDGLTKTKRIYYLLYAARFINNGYYIDNASTLNIMEAFIKNVYTKPEWINLTFTPDTIASLSTDTIGITINTTGLAPGNYNTKIFINCNNPVSPIIEIPISLIVSGIKVVNPIADVLKNEGFVSDTIDYSNVFVDAEGDELFYTIVSAEPGVVTVDTADGKILIDETGTGTSTITIRADDGGGSIEYFDFEYRVNANPKVITPIADILINEGFLTTTINLSEVFTDTDNDVLNYEFTNSSQETVGVSITDNILTIQEVAYGVSTISVTATDNIGIPAEDEFLITVNAMPELSKAISDTLVHEGFSSYTVDLSKIFTDADDDVLKYALTNSNPAAVSISVTDKILTIQEVAYGVSTVSVTASDSIGIPVSDEFVVTVNAIPTVANPLADIALDEGFVTRTVVLSNVFADNDDAQLVLSAVSSNPAVVTVSVTGTTLTVTETGTGTSNITVTAEDSKGASVSDMFVFTVNDISAVESITDAIIEFYPNPTKGKIYLSMGKGDNNQVNVEFTNIAGKVLMNYQFNNSGKVQELDLTRFAKGIYFMRIIYNDHSMIEKIIIEQ